jgi:succinylglutamate desuccinylase/GNAT superfamily N-acetyltransferase
MAAVDALVRVARSTDLAVLRVLIRESFGAMGDHYGEIYRPTFEKYGEESDDLKGEEAFMQTYFSNPGNNFWVVESKGSVVGSVGVKRKNAEEFDVVRMAVASEMRGTGMGKLLMRTLVEYCKEQKAPRIVLVTANPSAARFYSANGFQTKKCTQFTFPKMEEKGLPDLLGQMYSMVYYLGARIVRRVAVVGGTHGNERLGIELVKHWQRDPTQLHRSTLLVTPILANPPAIVKNVRFIDTDLNRQFPVDKLEKIMAATADPIDHLPVVGSKRKVDALDIDKTEGEAQEGSGEAEGPQSVPVSEDFCAARLNALLGPKTEHYCAPTGADFIIDLHSSTSNLGLMLILGSVSHDNTANGVANYLDQTHTCSAADKGDKGDMVRIASTDLPKASYFGLDSLAPSGMAIEVGPLAHGTMDSRLLEHTRRLVLGALDHLETRNLAILGEARASIARAYLEGSLGALNGLAQFDLASATFIPVELAPNSIIPDSYPEMSYYKMIAPVSFPRIIDGGEEEGGLEAAEPVSSRVSAQLRSSLAQVRSVPPRKYILHETLDRQDWVQIKDGADLFQAIDGSGRIIPFIREKHAPSEGADTKLYPVFINEAAYQDSSMAFWITRGDEKVTLY